MQIRYLSIITINYNNDIGLEKTICSVINQKNYCYEYIIIDGGSNDRSYEIIENYKEFLDYYVCEKDTGIYNAMNKGIIQAKGKYILFLNSGDVLYNENVLGNIRNYKDDLIYFDVFFSSKEYGFTYQYPYKLNFNYFLKQSLPHQATLIKRNLFIKMGFYDENLKICSDWAFFVNAIFKNNATYKKINIVFAKIDRSGISCDPINFSTIENERIEFLELNYPKQNKIYRKENLPVQKMNILKLTKSKLYKFYNLLKK